MKLRISVVVFLFLSALGGVFASAGSPLVTLESALTGVARTNPGLKAAETRIERARLQVDKADQLGWLSKFDFNMTTGVCPGDDPENYFKNFGPFVKTELAVVQPIFTFGKVSGARELARSGLDYEREKFADTRQRAAYEVIRLYRGLVAAQKGELVACDMMRDFTKLTNKVELELAKTNATIDDLDKLDVQIKSWQVHSLYLDVVMDRTNLMRAFNIALGRPEDDPVSVDDYPAPAVDFVYTNMTQLARRAAGRNPVLRSMRAALAAADAKVAIENANNYPDIFLGGGMRFNWAGNRDAGDDYNSKGVAAFIGAKWRLDLWRVGTETDIARTDRTAVFQSLRQAEEKFRMEVDKAVLEVRKAATVLERVRESLAAAKTYVRLAGDNYDLGLGTSKTVVGGFKALYEVSGQELKSELQFHVALAGLALTLGDINKYAEWIKHEKVILD